MTIERLSTNYGPMYVPDNDAGQYWWLANTGSSPEDEFIETIADLLEEREPFGTVIDVGANFGCWTLGLAPYATNVLAIEPQACVWDLLNKSIEESRWSPRIVTMCAAAGAELGEIDVPQLDLNVASNFGGIALGVAHHEQPDCLFKKEKMITLDSIYENDTKANSRQFTFIKIDVEGSEAAVLAGARKLIARHKPILFVEFDHKDSDEDALGDMIEAMGYSVDKYWGNFLGMPL